MSPSASIWHSIYTCFEIRIQPMAGDQLITLFDYSIAGAPSREIPEHLCLGYDGGVLDMFRGAKLFSLFNGQCTLWPSERLILGRFQRSKDISSCQSRDIWFPKARMCDAGRLVWAIGGGRRRCGGDFLMTIGHATSGVLPLPLFPSTLLLSPNLMAPFSHFLRSSRRLCYIGGVRTLGYLSSWFPILIWYNGYPRSEC